MTEKDWRNAKAILKLREQLNTAYPKRSKVSDGTIGDVRHSSNKSDHNPNGKGVVTAIDITHDPVNGMGGRQLANQLLSSGDKRIKYIISDGQIASGYGANHPYGVWRKYTGSNRHEKHVHISVRDGYYDQDQDWDIGHVRIDTEEANKRGLRLGDTGQYVRELQLNLQTLGFVLEVTGNFDSRTELVVKRFQRQNGLEDDGVAGPRTQEMLGKAIKAVKVTPKVTEAQKAVEAAAPKKGVNASEVGAALIAGAPVVAAGRQIADDVSTGLSSAMNLGPWVLLAVCGVAFGIYIFLNERRKKQDGAAAQKALAEVKDAVQSRD